MANYKLTNDYWEASGIYDIGQWKTQREINAGLKETAESNAKPITVSGAVASFDGADGVPLANLTVNIEPLQSGSGDPSPTNVRPISGWTGANIVVSPTQDAQDGTTYNITFPSSAGTVYGGTLDVTNGVLTVDRAKVSLGSLTWTSSERDRWNSSGIRTVVKIPPNADAKCGIISDSFAEYTNNGLYNDQSIIGCSVHQQGYLLVRNGSTTDTPTGELTYPLATTTTYTLTPTEVKAVLGQNNVWADCGDVNVQYGAYLTVVENQLGEKIPKVMLAPVEKTTTASKAYVLNELLIMDDTLYKVTSPISNGGTITVGTNVTETTIGAILTSLLNS